MIGRLLGLPVVNAMLQEMEFRFSNDKALVISFLPRVECDLKGNLQVVPFL